MVLHTGETATNASQQVETPDDGHSKLDVCLLMLYGHILFTSTSFTYAMSMLSPSIS